MNKQELLTMCATESYYCGLAMDKLDSRSGLFEYMRGKQDAYLDVILFLKEKEEN